MERTANMTYEDYAKFIISVTDSPTEGQILDAVKAAGANDDEASAALQSVRDFVGEAQIDSVEDPDLVLEKGKDPDDSITPEQQQDGMTLDDFVQQGDDLTSPDAAEQGVLVGEDDPTPRLPDDFQKEEGKPLDEDKVDEATIEPNDDVTLSGPELVNSISQYLDDNPMATNEDIKRYLQTMGVPGDRLREFMKGFDLLQPTSRVAHTIFSNVSYADAARWASENTELKAEEIRQILYNVGASDIEAEEAIQQLPPKPVEDPMIANDGTTAVDGDGWPGEEPGSDWEGIALQYVQSQPDITPEALMEILQGEGASPEEAQQVVSSVLGGEEFDPQMADQVMTPRGAGRIAHVYETLQGDVYRVTLDAGEDQFFGRDALSKYVVEKTAGSDVFGRIQSHMQENWYTDMDRLPRALKEGYEARLASTDALRVEVKEAIKTANPSEAVELMRLDDALENESNYCKEKLKSSFTVDEAEYLTSRPQFNVAASHAGQELGPSGGVIHQAAIDAERHLASIDWNYEVTAGADLFVEDIDSKFIADTGEVRRRAQRHIEAKTAVLSEEDRKPLVHTFMANVEKARKQAAIVARTTGTPKEASVDLPDDFEKGLFY